MKDVDVMSGEVAQGSLVGRSLPPSLSELWVFQILLQKLHKILGASLPGLPGPDCPHVPWKHCD
eukprot:5335625-Amphidinium_carterae.1